VSLIAAHSLAAQQVQRLHSDSRPSSPSSYSTVALSSSQDLRLKSLCLNGGGTVHEPSTDDSGGGKICQQVTQLCLFALLVLLALFLVPFRYSLPPSRVAVICSEGPPITRSTRLCLVPWARVWWIAYGILCGSADASASFHHFRFFTFNFILHPSSAFIGAGLQDFDSDIAQRTPVIS